MFDVLICTNLVNLTVALHGARPGCDRPALMLYEPRRFVPPTLPRVAVRRMGIGPWRLLRAAVAFRLVHTLYLPHDRLNWRVRWCRDRLQRVVYLDDGLDTHRRAPLNFDLDRPAPTGTAYFTFDDFGELPAWLGRFDVRRIGPLALLADTAPRPLLPLAGALHVFIESPGLDVAAVVQALALPDQSILVVRHPAPSKRGAWASRWRSVEGTQHGIEATLLQTEGLTWYFGETMALWFALHAANSRGHRLHVQLSDAQREALTGLRLEADGRLPGLYTASQFAGRTMSRISAS
jgi:hypothetical protein